MAATIRPITLGRYSDSVDAKDDEVTLLDNKKIYVGTGNDLEISHDGSHSLIKDTGTGFLKICTNNLKINNAANSENLITAEENGTAKLFYDDSDKLETTATGVKVTGNLEATGLKVTGPSKGVCTNNLIINGAMQLYQRDTGSGYTGTSSYTLDRWKLTSGGTDESPTVTKHDLTSSADALPWAAGLRHSLHLQNGNQTGGAGASDYFRIIQHIEGKNVRESGWNFLDPNSYITLSFWVKSSVAQNFYGYVRTQVNGASGANQLYSFETGSLSADTWTKITKTIPGHANVNITEITTAGLSFYIHPFVGTTYTGTTTLNQWADYSSSARTPDNTSTWWTTDDSTFEITGVQLELGQVANDFKHESYADTLSKCQRYFYLAASGADSSNATIAICFNYSANSARAVIHFPTTMRGIPDIFEVTGTNYWKILQASGASDYPDSIHGGNERPNMAEVTFEDDVSGMTAGESSLLRIDDAAARLGYDAEI
jgi:hypothetical protein